MTNEEWHALLTNWSAAVLRLTDTELDAGPLHGLGFEGATEAQLAAAETRIARPLPPSYRAFLTVTNGLRQPPNGGAARGGDFWSVDQVDWFSKRNAAWLDAYGDFDTPDHQYFVYGDAQDTVHFRSEYLRGALELSHNGDSSVYLLNPFVVDAQGEWETWHFANWYPGAARFRSFAEMMLSHYQGSIEDGIAGF
jgi:hypothetical protein